jgi:hypothetical protein
MTNPPICRNFQIIVDFGTSQSTIYESIARSMISTINNRMLTFHKDVKNSVSGFSELLFKEAINRILLSEFQDKLHMYKDESHFEVISFSAETKDRNLKLEYFNSCPDIDELKTDNWLLIIASCETISEGIDVPNCNGVVFADPKQSYTKIIQNIGRCCRIPIKKDIGPSTILLPITINQEKYQSATDDKSKNDIFQEDIGNEFKTILNVYAALRQSDPLFYKECLFENLNISCKKNKGSQTINLNPENIQIKSQSRHIQVRQSSELEILWTVTTLCDMLTTHTQSAMVNCIVKKTFDQRCDEILKFVILNERYPHKNSDNENEKYLYNVIGDLKKQKKGKRQGHRDLTEHEIERLEQIPGWIWKEKDLFVNFMNRLEEFKSYYVQNKKNPPLNTTLGNWVVGIRQMNNGSKKSTLDDERRNLLEGVKGWVWEKKDEYPEKVLAYKKFVDEKNRHPTSSKYADEEEKKLAKWKQTKRKINTQKRSRIVKTFWRLVRDKRE